MKEKIKKKQKGVKEKSQKLKVIIWSNQEENATAMPWLVQEAESSTLGSTRK